MAFNLLSFGNSDKFLLSVGILIAFEHGLCVHQSVECLACSQFLGYLASFDLYLMFDSMTKTFL